MFENVDASKLVGFSYIDVWEMLDVSPLDKELSTEELVECVNTGNCKIRNESEAETALAIAEAESELRQETKILEEKVEDGITYRKFEKLRSFKKKFIASAVAGLVALTAIGAGIYFQRPHAKIEYKNVTNWETMHKSLDVWINGTSPFYPVESIEVDTTPSDEVSLYSNDKPKVLPASEFGDQAIMDYEIIDSKLGKFFNIHARCNITDLPYGYYDLNIIMNTEKGNFMQSKHLWVNDLPPVIKDNIKTEIDNGTVEFEGEIYDPDLNFGEVIARIRNVGAGFNSDYPVWKEANIKNQTKNGYIFNGTLKNNRLWGGNHTLQLAAKQKEFYLSVSSGDGFSEKVVGSPGKKFLEYIGAFTYSLNEKIIPKQESFPPQVKSFVVEEKPEDLEIKLTANDDFGINYCRIKVFENNTKSANKLIDEELFDSIDFQGKLENYAVKVPKKQNIIFSVEIKDEEGNWTYINKRITNCNNIEDINN